MTRTSNNESQADSREWNSAVYHRLSAPQVSWGKKVLGRLKLRGYERVLDAGCGTGRLTADLLEALPHGRVVGIDLSRNMLRSARGHLNADFGGRLSLAACDFRHLPFQHAFDVIVSTAAFHWVLDHDRLFRNLHAALVPGGWLEVQCGGGPNIERLRERANRLSETPKFAPFLAGFREPWLFEDAAGGAETLQRAGFVDVETSVEAAPTSMDDAGHFKEFVRNIIFRLHLEMLPTEELRAEFMDTLTEQAAKDDPPFLLDYWRLNLRGRAA
ncbi:MAG TPA: methyltransferase domain-containing protein [Candidatus Sulfotelmatobacter sp.]|nr:methyltransferase domain-containing protein [Candidatus Sulfotelmatobacter sp.]